MKKIILIVICVSNAICISAQTTSDNCRKLANNSTYCLANKNGETVLTQDGKTMPGAVLLKSTPDNTKTKTENRYCVKATVWKKVVVMKEGEVVKGSVPLKGGATLTSDGKIIWSDKSCTVLGNGSCIDDSGTIYGANTSSVSQPKSVRAPQLDVVVNNNSSGSK